MRKIIVQSMIESRLFDAVFDCIGCMQRVKSHLDLLVRMLEMLHDLCQCSSVVCSHVLSNAHFIDVLSERLQMHRLELDLFVSLTSLLKLAPALRRALTKEHCRILMKQWQNLESILRTKWKTLERVTNRMKENKHLRRQFAKQIKEESLLKKAVTDLQKLIKLVK